MKQKLKKNATRLDIFDTYKNKAKIERFYQLKSLPKSKSIRNYHNYDENMKFTSIIKNKDTIEDYYHEKYYLEYLNDEDINYLINIRNKKYPMYNSMTNNSKIEKINDDFLKKFFKNIWRKSIKIGEYENNFDQKYIEGIDLIILKEIQYEHQIKRHFKKEKKMEIISDRILGNIDNNKKLNKEDFLKDIDELGKYLKEEIYIEKRLQKEKDNYIELDEKNMDNIGSNIYILSALSYKLNKEGIMTIIEKKCKNKKILNATLQLISSDLISLKKYNLKLDFGSPDINDSIVLNPKIRNKFKNEFIQNLSKLYNISENDIVILDIKRGSVEVSFTLLVKINNIDEGLKAIFRKKYVHITEEVLFKGCKISEELLDPKGNNFGYGYEQYNFIRGGEIYDPPYEWFGYGLKVLNNYDNMNNDWLACNNNPNEWAVAYHGVGGKNCGTVFKNVNSIVKNNLIPGIRQRYENVDNIREWTIFQGYHKCGRGVYLTPIIEEAEKYAETEYFLGKAFKLIMMCRVNPKKIREPDRGNENPFWILNGNSKEIRPYRILIKELLY